MLVRSPTAHAVLRHDSESQAVWTTSRGAGRV